MENTSKRVALVDGAAGLATTAAGLVVPQHVVEKKHRTLSQDTFKRATRFIRSMRDEQIGVLIGCMDCKTPLNIEAVDRIDERQPGGRVQITCQCSVREVR